MNAPRHRYEFVDAEGNPVDLSKFDWHKKIAARLVAIRFETVVVLIDDKQVPKERMVQTLEISQ